MKMQIAAAAAMLTGALTMGTAASADNELPLPDVDTCFKSYMDYRTITNEESVQYDIQQRAYTDEQGIRRLDGDVCVALGTAYAEKCGERFEITLDSGTSFTAVAGDIKSDRHTDPTNSYVELGDGCGDMVEFIVDTGELDKSIRITGSIGSYEEYSGSVTSIVRLDRDANLN